MEKYLSKSLYPILFSKKWLDPYEFIECVAKDANHHFWGSGGAGREFAKEILSKDDNWNWLAYRIDDFANLVEEEMRKKLSKWIWRSKFDIGGLSKHLTDTETATKWLMDRYTAELKNLFDERYKNHVRLKDCLIVNYDTHHCCNNAG
jgi:hypothetical protein